MKKTDSLPKNSIFSLDIGTRNVVGMIAVLEEDHYKIYDYEMKPHPERAMFDGQIHDINRVSKVVQEIVNQLDKRNNIELKEVAIAAAGRALKTKDVSVSREIDYTKAITKDLIDNIEMEAVQVAQRKLDREDELETKYYCVGYTAKQYFLDKRMIKSPLDHRGSEIEVELIATFLPHSVVDSLYTVVDKVGLEVINLTLEPIAAINIAIADKLRMLNLALVDVGAGTSDIALTKEGAIYSYGMVAKAGDVITDQLSKEFLLGFDAAEKMKLELKDNDEVKFTDVVGITQTKKTEEILSFLDPVIEELTMSISEEIKARNKRQPSAVFCIGGGCQIPTFTTKLANQLGLKEERVVVKGVQDIDNVSFYTKELKGPEYITPIGIGFSGLKERERDFLQVTVNNKTIRLFNSKKLSVSDALILIGFNARDLLAKRGQSIEYTLNGETKSIRGSIGKPAQIYVNGSIASLDTKIKNKDTIYIEKAVPGKVKETKLSEIVDFYSQAKINDHSLELINECLVNGMPAEPDYVVQAADQVEVNNSKTLKDACTLLGIDYSKHYFLKDEHVVELSYVLQPDDEIEMKAIEIQQVEIEEKEMVEAELKQHSRSAQNINSKNPKSKEKNHYEIIVNGKRVVVNEKKNLIFVDIFEYIDFDLKTPKGILDLRLNGKRAKYTDVLKDGDVIDISWRK